MTLLNSILLICGTHLAVAISPGPNMIAICCTASLGSRRAGLLVAAGVVTATGLWAGLALLGTKAILDGPSHILDFLYLLSGCYLTAVGLRMLVTPPAGPKSTMCRRPFLLGLLTALSNPIAMAFWLGTFLSAMPESIPEYFRILIFGLIILQSTAVYFTLAVLASSAMPGRIFSAARGLRRIGAGAMILIGMNALLAP